MKTSMRRSGFTITEVVIALLVFVVAVLVVLLLLPGAMQAQQVSRYRLLAAMHAQHLMDQFLQNDETDWRSAGGAKGMRSLTGPTTRLSFPDPIPAPTDSGLHLVHRDRPMMHEQGRFDLERMLVNGKLGHYALPISIARRLDSPDGTIQKVLDEGGYIYYSNMPGTGMGETRSLIWTVVGAAQQNVLPFTPVSQPYRELYPFPPQARPVPVDRVYRGSLKWEYQPDGLPRMVPRGERYRGHMRTDRDVWVQHYVPVQTGDGLHAYDTTGAGHITFRDDGRPGGNPTNVHNDDHGKNRRGGIYTEAKYEFSDYERNNWEWLAYRHQQGDQLGRQGDAGAKWSRGLPYFRNLVNKHWLRIVHQLDSRVITVEVDDLTTTDHRVEREVPVWRTRVIRDGNNQVVRDQYGNPQTERYQDGVKTETDIHDQVDVELPDGGTATGYATKRNLSIANKQNKGYPAPANGMGYGHLRGSDILEEDAIAHNHAIEGQLRVSLPSLERRIMYRSAALALWAAVAYDKDITDANDPNLIYVQVPGGARPSPPANKDVLLPNENPLLPEFRAPAPELLHPAEVLALSHLAHAAIMVTGYKQPFVHTYNTLDVGDDTLLVDPTTSYFGDLEDHGNRLPHGEELPYTAQAATGCHYEDLQAENPKEVHVLLDRNGDGVADATQAVDFDPTTGVALIGKAIANLHPHYFHPEDRDDPSNRKFAFFDGMTVQQVPGTADAGVIAIHPDDNTYLMNPYQHGLMRADEPTPGTPAPTLRYHANNSPPNDAQIYQMQVDSSGNKGDPILIRRRAGAVINPFPPPYADREAIGMDGRRQYRSRWILYVHRWLPHGATPEPSDLTTSREGIDPPTSEVGADATWVPEFRLARIIPGGGTPDGQGDSRSLPREGKDTAYAREALEHSLAAAMAYTAEHPYDMTVPRPYNRQTFADRGIYQLDIFDAGGQARRPQTGVTGRVHPVTFPVDARRNDTALFAASWATVRALDSLADRHHIFKETQPAAPMHPNSQPLLFGNPSQNPAHRSETYKRPEHYSRWTNRLHDWRDDAAVQLHAKRPERCTAVRAFEAEDRCRQLVYWLVNWTQYEDFESAPSAPVDASQIDKRRFLPKVGEQSFAWIDPERTATPSSWDRSRATVDDSDPRAHLSPNNIAFAPESGHWALPLANFTFTDPNPDVQAITSAGRDHLILSKLGAFGADRNRNGAFNRGPVSATTRMNAVEVARFTYYDPIVWMRFRR